MGDTKNLATEEDRGQRYQNGRDDAKAALEAARGPIFLKDEVADDLSADPYAMGWNSVWSSVENTQRRERAPASREKVLDDFRVSNLGHASFSKLTTSDPFECFKRMEGILTLSFNNGRLADALDAVLKTEVGQQTFRKLEDGQGTQTADGKAWLAAKALLNELRSNDGAASTTMITAETDSSMVYCPSCGTVMIGEVYEADRSKILTRCTNHSCSDFGKRYSFPAVTVELTSLDD